MYVPREGGSLCDLEIEDPTEGMFLVWLIEHLVDSQPITVSGVTVIAACRFLRFTLGRWRHSSLN